MASGRLAELFLEIGAKANYAQAFLDAKNQLADLKLTAGLSQQHYDRIAAVQRQINQAKASVEWKAMVAEQGKFGAGLSWINQHVSRFSSIAGVAFGSGMAAMTGLAAAASPETFQTFTGSIRLLAASVGTAFTPVLIEASRWLQRAAFWFQSLDPEMVKSVGKWIGIGTAIAGVVFVGGKLIAVGASVLTVLVSLGSGAVALAGRIGLITSSATAAAGALQRLQAQQATGGGGGLLGVGMGMLYAGAAIEGVQAAVNGYNGGGVGGTSGVAGAISNVVSNVVPGGGNLAGSLAQNAVANLVASGAITTNQGGGTPAGGTPGQGLLPFHNFQSQSLNIEQQWQRLQQVGASLSPGEQRIVEINLQQLAALNQVVANTGGPPVQIKNSIGS